MDRSTEIKRTGDSDAPSILDHRGVKMFDRKFVARLGGETSAALVKHREVPQGSSLDPVLFNMYTSDLPSCVWNCTIHQYTDDCQLHLSYNSELIEEAIVQISADLQLTGRRECVGVAGPGGRWVAVGGAPTVLALCVVYSLTKVPGSLQVTNSSTAQVYFVHPIVGATGAGRYYAATATTAAYNAAACGPLSLGPRSFVERWTSFGNALKLNNKDVDLLQ
ncbi:hypothetical protein J6590_070310 [Homalodisca vitripennis]|nr:hypothetical protein J6590_070310 [Homalodisca vitripennis]